MSANVLNVEARADATRHGRNLAYLTIGWNSLEAVVYFLMRYSAGWWADPIAAVVMLPIIAKEGIDAMQGKTCCDSGGCH